MYYQKNDGKQILRNMPEDVEEVISYSTKIDKHGVYINDSILLDIENTDTSLLYKYYMQIESDEPVNILLDNLVNFGIRKTTYDGRGADSSYDNLLINKYIYPTNIDVSYNNKALLYNTSSTNYTRITPNCFLFNLNITSVLENTFVYSLDTYKNYRTGVRNSDYDAVLKFQYDPKICNGNNAYFTIDDTRTGVIGHNDYDPLEVEYDNFIIQNVSNNNKIYTNDFFYPPQEYLKSTELTDCMIFSQHEFYTDFVDIDFYSLGIFCNIFSNTLQNVKIKIFKKVNATQMILNEIPTEM